MPGSRPAYHAVRIVLGGMFLAAGAIKLADPEQLAVVIDAFGLIPPGLVLPVAYLLPLVEIAAGIGLMVDLRGSLSVIAALTVIFLAVLGHGLRLGLDIDCGCYGPGDPEAKAFSGLRDAFGRDLFLLGGVFYCYWWRWNAGRKVRCAASQSVASSKEKTHA